jgi:hypothetical protein
MLVCLLFLSSHVSHAQTPDGGTRTFEGGSIRVFVSPRGQIGNDPTDIGGGLLWPGAGLSPRISRVLATSSSPVLYGRVRGTRRVTVAHFFDTFIPGPVIDGHPVSDPTDPRFRMYTIDEDSTLSQDYRTWPADLGAPVDAGMAPLLYGPRQMYWVMNDLDSVTARARNSCDPLGLELRLLLYEPRWHDETVDALALQVTSINQSVDTIQDAYIGYYLDVDIRDGLNDLVGTDSLRALVYAYDGTVSAEVDGMPAALGLAMLQTPVTASPGSRARWNDGWKSDARNIPISAAVAPAKAQVTAVREPLVGEGWPYQWEVLLRGEGSGVSVHNPRTGHPSAFWFSGDPVRGTGWLPRDGISLSDGRHLAARPGDQRMLISAGPVSMAPGDTQQVTFALVAARGATPQAAVYALRDKVELLQRRFERQLPIDGLREAMATSSPTPGALDVRARFTDAPDALRIEVIDAQGNVLTELPLTGTHADGEWLYTKRIVLPGAGRDGVSAAFIAFWGDDSIRIPAGVSIPTHGGMDLDGIVMVDEGDHNGRVAPDEEARWFPRLNNQTPHAYDVLLQSHTQPRAQWLRVPGLSGGATAPSADYPWSPSMGLCALLEDEVRHSEDTLLRFYDIYDPSANSWWPRVNTIPFDSATGDWYDVLMTQVDGASDERPGVRIVDPAALRDRWYVATIEGVSNMRFLALHDSATGNPLFTGFGLDSFTGAAPQTDGFRVVRGTITNETQNPRTAMRSDRFVFNPRHTLLARSQKPASIFSVSAPAPTPFAGWTSVRITLPDATRLRAAVYNTAGQRVRILRDEPVDAGRHLLIWDGYWDDARPAESGMYLLRIQTSSHADTRKILVVR